MLNSLKIFYKIIFLKLIFSFVLIAQHNAGSDCLYCHNNFKACGTIFSDSLGRNTASNVRVTFLGVDNVSVAANTNSNGNLVLTSINDGSFIIKVGELSSRTWHKLPQQASCNKCHVLNQITIGKVKHPFLHTRLPENNDCRNCHHFPVTQKYENLLPYGVLTPSHKTSSIPGSFVFINNKQYSFDPKDYNTSSFRADIFAPGYFSMFDVIIKVAQKNGIPIEYYYDVDRKTYFITKVNSLSGNYWFGFSYDTGSSSSNQSEVNYNRANRWDETLWRPGAWTRLIQISDAAMQEIKNEYLEEINREKVFGHLIPSVQIQLNPSNYQGNPSGSNRVTVSKNFTNVQVTAHNYRASTSQNIFSKPFQPGVVTSLDILLSLKDQGMLDAVTGVFYTRFAGNYIDSYYVVEMGFPGIGTAHSSGRQGFVYVTENGSFNKLPNNADSKLHITSDINVIHAQDFSYWRWIELGNPYYEQNPPTSVEDELIAENYESIPRGFNLHPPYPNPFNGSVKIQYNIFEPGEVNISVYDMLGRNIIELFNDTEQNIGVKEILWDPKNLSSGVYLITMRFNKNLQTRQLVYLK